jgi:hypothetical protein
MTIDGARRIIASAKADLSRLRPKARDAAEQKLAEMQSELSDMLESNLAQLRASHESAYAAFNAAIAAAFPGYDEWHYFRACSAIAGENCRRNDDTSHDAELAAHPGIDAAWSDYRDKLHAYYRARDGEGGVLGGRGL